jgi:hypothetical protein
MATQAQVDAVARGIAGNMGAAVALRELRAELMRRRLVDLEVVRMIDYRLALLAAEGRRLDGQFFGWMDEDMRVLDN